jgi:signal transduction histidine kinase
LEDAHAYRFVAHVECERTSDRQAALRRSGVGMWELRLRDGFPEASPLTWADLFEDEGPGVTSRSGDGPWMAIPSDRYQVLAALRRLGCFEVEYRIRRGDGSVQWTLARGTLLRDAEGRPASLVGASIDITARKLIEEDTRRAREVAESHDRRKDELLAEVSHEVRTFVNAIVGMTTLALETPTCDGTREVLAKSKRAAEEILSLTDDLLDSCRLNAGKLELHLAQFSLRALLVDALDLLAPRAERKGLKLECDVLPDVPDAVVGDPGRLRQVLLNIVGNAIKFTERGGVAVQVTSPNPARALAGAVDLEFTVRDTGIGIPLEEQERIFRPFEQESSALACSPGGWGLGLSVAKRLVALMSGQIKLTSAPGGGSVFAFSARLELGQSCAIPSSTLPAQRSASPAIVGVLAP